eukprot:3937470-Rhodomonas_salina.1
MAKTDEFWDLNRSPEFAPEVYEMDPYTPHSQANVNEYLQKRRNDRPSSVLIGRSKETHGKPFVHDQKTARKLTEIVADWKDMKSFFQRRRGKYRT